MVAVSSSHLPVTTSGVYHLQCPHISKRINVVINSCCLIKVLYSCVDQLFVLAEEL